MYVSLNCSILDIDTRSEACQRFFRDGLTVSFTKILTDEAVNGWKYEIHVSSSFVPCPSRFLHLHINPMVLFQRCIFSNALKLIELCVVKLSQDWFPLLDLLAMVLNPASKSVTSPCSQRTPLIEYRIEFLTYSFPRCRFHSYNGNRPSESVPQGTQPPDDEVFARSPDARVQKVGGTVHVHSPLTCLVFYHVLHPAGLAC